MTTMTTSNHPASTSSDDRLWLAARSGNRDAFGLIVTRYQSLVCSVAYSGLGNIAASQDLAQETFVTAWRQMDDLREPAKLRGWLCGIARTLVANVRRKETRRGGVPASLDAIAEPATAADDPLAQAVSREEEVLLWRAIGALPESYREPIVLFYREEQSVADVAALLNLSQETVKQRLSRGRAMLRGEVASLVESALSRTRPSGAFTAGVLAAITVVAPTASAAATAGASAAAAGAASSTKGALGLGGGAVVVGPAAGLATAWLASKLLRLTARSTAEQRVIGRQFKQGVTFALVMVVGLLAGIFASLKYFPDSPWVLITLTCAWTGILLVRLGLVNDNLQREIDRVRVETGTTDAEHAPHLASRGVSAGPQRYSSSWQLFGLPLFAYATGGLDVGSYRTRGARGWIAIGDLAFSPLLAIGGMAVAPIAIGGVTVGVLSLSIAGVAFGMLAFGSVAAGWWAIGAVAVGWKAAAGAVAVARDFAVGSIARAAEANTAGAAEWFKSQWFTPVAAIFGAMVPWLILLAIVVPLGLIARRAWALRRSS